MLEHEQCIQKPSMWLLTSSYINQGGREGSQIADPCFFIPGVDKNNLGGESEMTFSARIYLSSD